MLCGEREAVFVAAALGVLAALRRVLAGELPDPAGHLAAWLRSPPPRLPPDFRPAPQSASSATIDHSKVSDHQVAVVPHGE